MTKISIKAETPQTPQSTIPASFLLMRCMSKKHNGQVTSSDTVTTSALMYILKLSLLISMRGPQQRMQMNRDRRQTAIEMKRMDGQRKRSTGVQILLWFLLESGDWSTFYTCSYWRLRIISRIYCYCSCVSGQPLLIRLIQLKSLIIFSRLQSLTRKYGVSLITLITSTRHTIDGAIKNINMITLQFLSRQKQPTFTRPPSEKNTWINMLYFCLFLLSMVSVIKQKQILMAESDPQPIRNSPIPTTYKLGAATATTIPSVATPYEINNAFHLPILSTIMDTETQPKKQPIQTSEVRKSGIQDFVQWRSEKLLAIVRAEDQSRYWQRWDYGREQTQAWHYQEERFLVLDWLWSQVQGGFIIKNGVPSRMVPVVSHIMHHTTRLIVWYFPAAPTIYIRRKQGESGQGGFQVLGLGL